MICKGKIWCIRDRKSSNSVRWCAHRIEVPTTADLQDFYARTLDYIVIYVLTSSLVLIESEGVNKQEAKHQFQTKLKY